MALELVKTPDAGVDAGIFNLPPDFDTKRYAAEWVEEGRVAFKQQRQVLPQTGYTADGWEVYKEGKSAVKVTGGDKKVYVLMVRPRVIQQQVNALFGNVSKAQLRRERKGETVAGAPQQDPGMLTEQRLSQVAGEGSMVGEDTDLQDNKLGNLTASLET